MIKKVVIGLMIVAVIGVAGIAVLTRSVFGRDAVRAALASQLSNALGQPVVIGSVTASVYPRVTVRLGNVEIGAPGQIHVQTLDIGTDLRALFSRRIEHANVHLDGARIQLPLPAFTITPPDPNGNGAAASGPVEIISIDEIILNGVEVVSGGRSLRGDIAVVPHGGGMTVRSVVLSAEDTTLNASGEITSISAPAGTLSLKAGTLNLDRLLGFANDFAGGAAVSGSGATAAPSPQVPTADTKSAMDIVLNLEADRATIGAMAVDQLTGRAAVRSSGVSLDPVAFTLFGGRYDGAIAVDNLSRVPSFTWRASLAGIDVAAASAFAGSPNTVSGRLSGRVSLSGQGADLTAAMKTARGTAAISVADGVVRNLGLIRAIVAATALNPNALKEAAASSRDEPFTRLGATWAIAGGTASTEDLRFESPDVTLMAAGNTSLDGSRVDFKGQVHLSEALSKQAAGGSGVMRVAQDNGRLVVPLTVTGPATAPQVHIDAQDMAKRALRNAAAEQGEKLFRGLGGLIRR